MTIRRNAKSEWCSISCNTPEQKAACLSWFSPLCDGYEPLKCETLDDIETGQSRKMRALFRDDRGRLREAVRTLGGRYNTITLKQGPSPEIISGVKP